MERPDDADTRKSDTEHCTAGYRRLHSLQAYVFSQPKMERNCPGHFGDPGVGFLVRIPWPWPWPTLTQSPPQESRASGKTKAFA